MVKKYLAVIFDTADGHKFPALFEVDGPFYKSYKLKKIIQIDSNALDYLEFIEIKNAVFWKWKTTQNGFRDHITGEGFKNYDFESDDDAKLWFEVEYNL